MSTIIGAVTSITAACVAGVFALASHRFEARIRRASEAHERIADEKRQMYQPMIELLEHMFTSDDVPTGEQLAHKRSFDHWVGVYGSDGVVRTYWRFMEALPHDPPGDIQFRLYADFLLEVRKDVGDPHSSVDRRQVLGPRLVNLVDQRSLTDPNLDAVCKRLGWSPPWRPAT